MVADEGARRERNPIASVVRLLGALAAHDGPAAGVRELARLTGAAPSSVQRTLEAAQEVSLVATTAGGQWELGWELYRIAAIAQSKRPFQAAAPILETLAEQTSETAVLTVFDPRRLARMFVAAAPSRHSVRFVPELFTWMPAYAGASALAILAFRPESERRAVYAAADAFPAVAPALHPAKVEAVLRTVRERGFATSHDEVNLGASAVGAPVIASSGITCSVAVIAPEQRLDSAARDTMVGQVLQAATAISHRIGDPLAPLEVVS